MRGHCCYRSHSIASAELCASEIHMDMNDGRKNSLIPFGSIWTNALFSLLSNSCFEASSWNKGRLVLPLRFGEKHLCLRAQLDYLVTEVIYLIAEY